MLSALGVGVNLLAYTMMLVVFITSVLYMGWFAKIVRNKKMAGRAKHFIWSGPLMAITSVFLMMIGALIALVMYWNMVEYTRRDLKKIIDARIGE